MGCGALRCRPIATLVAIAPAPAHALVKSQGRCLIGRAQVGARLLKQTPMALRRVLAPKLGGAGNLAALTPCAPVAWAATFSSVSALAGFAGHANYCAANAAADALAAAAAVRGAPVLAVQWGAWAAVGAPGHELCMHQHSAASQHTRRKRTTWSEHS